MRPMRSPLPRSVLTRLETGRLVVLSVLLGMLVGGLGILLRLALDALATLRDVVIGYSPPGTPGEGGLMMTFGAALPWALLVLPALGMLYTALTPARRGDALNALIASYHTRAPLPGLRTQLGTLGAAAAANASGLLVGRDTPFLLAGQLGAALLRRVTSLDAVEFRTLTLAGAASALGLVLHAPLAAAVLLAEVLYRRFEFEFEVLMPCLLAAVAGSAVYGLAFGFSPLFSVPTLPAPAAPQLAQYLLIALATTLAAVVAVLLSRLLPATVTGAWYRPLLGGLFGLLTAAVAVFVTPDILGGGSGWQQLALSGFVGTEGLGLGLLRWTLLALGAQLAFGGGVLPSVAIGGLLGTGLGSLLGVDPAIASMIGAVSVLTVTLNVPVAAALLATTWGGEALLPLALVAAGIAHVLSGPRGLMDAQVTARKDSGAHNTAAPLLPEGIRYAPRVNVVNVTSVPAAVPFDRPAAPEGALRGERELYRRSVPRSWQGTRLSLVALPPGVEVVGVIRDGTVRVPRPDLRLTPDDELIFLADAEAFTALEGVLRLTGS